MSQNRARARHLRKNLTDAERTLWQKLRYWQVGGCKFRRQQPLGRYIVDFVCLQKRLIVELDGGQHAQQENYDTERDSWLRDQGFVVLRFWNNDAMTNMDLNPSPQGGKMKIRNAKHSNKFALEQ